MVEAGAADPIAWPEAGLGDLCALGEPAHLALGPTRVIVVAAARVRADPVPGPDARRALPGLGHPPLAVLRAPALVADLPGLVIVVIAEEAEPIAGAHVAVRAPWLDGLAEVAAEAAREVVVPALRADPVALAEVRRRLRAGVVPRRDLAMDRAGDRRHRRRSGRRGRAVAAADAAHRHRRAARPRQRGQP